MAQCFHIGSICLKTAEALKGETASQPVFQNSFMTSKNSYTHFGFTVYELWLSWNLAQTSINAGTSNFVRLCLALAFYSQLWTLPYLSDHTLDRVIMRLIRTNDRGIYSRSQRSLRIQGSSIFSSTFAGVVLLCHALCTPGAQQDTPISSERAFVIPRSVFRQTCQSECRLSLAELRPRTECWQPGCCIRKTEAAAWCCVLGPVSFYQHIQNQLQSLDDGDHCCL